jgi:hypothetical protein
MSASGNTHLILCLTDALDPFAKFVIRIQLHDDIHRVENDLNRCSLETTGPEMRPTIDRYATGVLFDIKDHKYAGRWENWHVPKRIASSAEMGESSDTTQPSQG